MPSRGRTLPASNRVSTAEAEVDEDLLDGDPPAPAAPSSLTPTSPAPSSLSSSEYVPASSMTDLSDLVRVAASRMSSPRRSIVAADKQAAKLDVTAPTGGDAFVRAFGDGDTRREWSRREGSTAPAALSTPAALRKNSLLGRAGVMDASTKKLLSSAAAEAVGLGIICFFGCMGTLNGPLGQVLPHMQVALTFGLVVMVAIACFAHVSGAHFNPAVTLLALIMKIVDIKTAIVYLISQCIGGTLGYGLLKVVTPTSLLYWGRVASANVTANGPCCTVPHAELSASQAVLGELLGTAALLMLCCSVWDPRNAANTDGIPIKFGLLIAAVALCLGPYTGASLNPARSLAPAVWEGTWTLHWVYWVGPLSAAVLLGYGWPLAFSAVAEPPVKDHADVPLTLVSGDGKRHSRLAEDDNGDVKGAF